MPDPAPRAPRVTAQALATRASCARKLWLQHHRPDAAAPPAAHVLVLRERASAHQRAVVARLPDVVGPIWRREGSFAEAAAETRRLLAGRRTLHRPAFLSADGRCSCVPDLVSWDDDLLVVTDIRLALRPETRPDFAMQMAHHRALVRATAGIEPARFEIVNGYGETVTISPASEAEYAATLAAARETLSAEREPDDLLAHSTCRACDWYAHCWDRAEAERRIEVLPEVQAAHVPRWHAAGVRTLDQLAARDPERPPAGVQASHARRAVLAASAWRDDRAVWLAPPRLPAGPLVWFDLEGDARGEDADIPIYLWGFALESGGAPPRSEALFAAFTPDGDRLAWERFTARSTAILDANPGVRWVHWDHYEPLWIGRYTDRLGAPAGFRERLSAACFDLKRVLDRCVRLPLRSYSIKHVARWTGFAWRNPDAGSEWSTARFERARLAADPADRESALRDLAEYNEDDLLAMRAIWRWIEAHAPRDGGPGTPRGRLDEPPAGP
jgi:predicted RecB family nuclease